MAAKFFVLIWWINNNIAFKTAAFTQQLIIKNSLFFLPPTHLLLSSLCA